MANYKKDNYYWKGHYKCSMFNHINHILVLYFNSSHFDNFKHIHHYLSISFPHKKYNFEQKSQHMQHMLYHIFCIYLYIRNNYQNIIQHIDLLLIIYQFHMLNIHQLNCFSKFNMYYDNFYILNLRNLRNNNCRNQKHIVHFLSIFMKDKLNIMKKKHKWHNLNRIMRIKIHLNSIHQDSIVYINSY